MRIDRAGSPMNEPIIVHSRMPGAKDACNGCTGRSLLCKATSNFGLSTMPHRNFISRRQWHNTLVMVWAAPFLLLVLLLMFAITGHMEAPVIGAVILVTGLGLALLRDMRPRSRYTVRGDRIVLENNTMRSEIPAEELSDASLIDRTAAREYIREHMLAQGATSRAERRRAEKGSTRFCSIDIGLGSWTFGIMRRLI